jgi:hypothetical protein
MEESEFLPVKRRVSEIGFSCIMLLLKRFELSLVVVEGSVVVDIKTAICSSCENGSYLFPSLMHRERRRGRTSKNARDRALQTQGLDFTTLFFFFFFSLSLSLSLSNGPIYPYNH